MKLYNDVNRSNEANRLDVPKKSSQENEGIIFVVLKAIKSLASFFQKKTDISLSKLQEKQLEELEDLSELISGKKEVIRQLHALKDRLDKSYQEMKLKQKDQLSEEKDKHEGIRKKIYETALESCPGDDFSKSVSYEERLELKIQQVSDKIEFVRQEKEGFLSKYEAESERILIEKEKEISHELAQVQDKIREIDQSYNLRRAELLEAKRVAKLKTNTDQASTSSLGRFVRSKITQKTNGQELQEIDRQLKELEEEYFKDIEAFNIRKEQLDEFNNVFHKDIYYSRKLEELSQNFPDIKRKRDELNAKLTSFNDKLEEYEDQLRALGQAQLNLGSQDLLFKLDLSILQEKNSRTLVDKSKLDFQARKQLLDDLQILEAEIKIHLISKSEVVEELLVSSNASNRSILIERINAVFNQNSGQLDDKNQTMIWEVNTPAKTRAMEVELDPIESSSQRPLVSVTRNNLFTSIQSATSYEDDADPTQYLRFGSTPPAEKKD